MGSIILGALAKEASVDLIPQPHDLITELHPLLQILAAGFGLGLVWYSSSCESGLRLLVLCVQPGFLIEVLAAEVVPWF